MKLHRVTIHIFCVLLGLITHVIITAEASKPNIVYIIADDLGYGEIHALAPKTSKIPTPGTDNLAAQGMIFTDAHSGSAVCTPTRYGIMTGRYSWRTQLQRGVVTGFAPSLIAEGRPTVASFLREQGYDTAIIGKWHLNFQYLNPQSDIAYKKKDHKFPPIGSKVPDGPLSRGFDFYHGFHHARNMKAVIENDRVIEHDDEINMLPRLTRKSVEYIQSRAGNAKPFFLYVPLGSPHNPIVPSPEWQGKSGISPHADFVMQTDHVVVEVSKALERHGLNKNTLVIFTSDNGTSKAADIDHLEAHGHFPSAHLRGSKADLWDGGHRIPFVVHWPGKVAAGSQSDQLICLTDLLATTADILGVKVPAGSGEDSVSFLPALSDSPIDSSRNGVTHHSSSGHFAYRHGKWKLLLARGSGGWSAPNERQVEAGTLEAQLYDMEKDAGETNNLYTKRPNIAKRLLALMNEDVNSGRSTNGPASQNDVIDIVLWKSGRGPAPAPVPAPKKK
jgi:arylsulfatase A